MKKIILVPIILIFLAAAGVGAASFLPEKDATTTLTSPSTSKVREGDFIMTSFGTGTLEGTASETLYFSTSGVIKDLAVNPGDSVQSGDVVAILNDSAEQLTIQKALLNLEKVASASVLAQNEIDIYQAKETLMSAEENLAFVLAGPPIEYYESQLAAATDAYFGLLARISKLKSPSAQLAKSLENAKLAYEQAQIDLDNARAYIVPPEDILRSQAEVNLAAANVQVAESLFAYLSGTPLEAIENLSVSQDLIAVKQAEWQVLTAQQALDATRLTTPIDGTVTRVNALVGESITSNTPILTITNPQETILHVWIDESELGALSIGDSVQVKFHAYPDLVFSAHITSIDFSIVNVDGNNKVQAWAAFDQAIDISLPIGAEADVEIITVEEKDVLTVPYQALMRTDNGAYQVIVLEEGQPTYRTVTIGMSDFASVIIESGLSAGETIVTNPDSIGEESL